MEELLRIFEIDWCDFDTIGMIRFIESVNSGRNAQLLVDLAFEGVHQGDHDASWDRQILARNPDFT